MKKITKFFLIIILLIPFNILALEKQYDLTKYNIKISLPSGYETIIKGYDNNSECNKLGVDEEQIMDYMNNLNAYALATTQDLQKNIIFTRTQDDYTRDYYNLTKLDSDIVNALADGFSKGFNIDNYDIEKINNITYMIFKYDLVSTQGEHLYYLKYKTFYNGYDYTFYIQKYSEITADDEVELKNVVNNLIIEEIEKNNSISNAYSITIWGFIIFAIVTIVYLILKHNNKKLVKTEKVERNNKKEGRLNSIKNESNIRIKKETKIKYKCDNCGAIISEDTDKCPKCHAKFTDEEEIENNMNEKTGLFKCDNCGAIVNESETKCPVCGESFDDDNNIDKKYSDLNKLKELLDNNIITKEEFDKEKKKILK